MAKVWLITGGERGLGRYIAEAALASGEHVLATASRSERLAELQALYGTRLCVLPQAADDLAARGLAQAALEAFGRVDVLVNTAGPGRMAPFEQIEDGDFRAEMDEHFFGLANLTRAVLPIMRQQRSGHIINVSSVGGRFGAPGLAAYQASKWAVGGFTEALAREVAAFGVKLCCLEPGDLARDLPRGIEEGAWLPEYRSTMEAGHKQFIHLAGNETGDPARVAQIVLRLAYHSAPPAHLLLGSDALRQAGQADVERTEAELRWRVVTLATDRNAHLPLPALPRR